MGQNLDDEAFTFDDLGRPQLRVGFSETPDSCTVEVINAALRVASKVATKGVGEQQKAKGFLIIIGEREQLMGNELGKPPEPKFNMFIDDLVTIDDVEKQGAAQRYVYPAFTTDGAMIIDGSTGEILASNYTVTANLETGSNEGGKKHQAASAIAQKGPCFVIKCSEDSCSVDGQAHGDFGVFIGGHSATARGKEAIKISVKGSNPAKVEFYMHIAVQPAPVVTAHLSQRRKFMSEMDGLSNKLKDSGQEWLEKGRYPICLSDAREELLKPQLLAGCVNVLVWCATGIGWEVEATPCPLQLPGIINAIKQAPVKPRLAIVCLAHGPMRAAEALHKSGVSVVIWFRADLSKVSLSRLFEQAIVPALEEMQTLLVRDELLRKLRVSAEVLLGSGSVGCVGDVGASDSWTPDKSQRSTWLVDMREQQLTQTNLLACMTCGKHPNISPEPLLACDVPLVAELHNRLCSQTLVSLSPGSNKETLRCRIIALEACLAHAQARGQFSTVYRIATRSDLSDAEHCCTIKPNKSAAGKVLIWIDGTMLRNALSSWAIEKDAIVEVKMRSRGGADVSGALEQAEQATLKIQAQIRGNLARDRYKDIRDEEARKQWLKYYVLIGNYAEARKLGWNDSDAGEPGKSLEGADTTTGRDGGMPGGGGGGHDVRGVAGVEFGSGMEAETAADGHGEFGQGATALTPPLREASANAAGPPATTEETQQESDPLLYKAEQASLNSTSSVSLVEVGMNTEATANDEVPEANLEHEAPSSSDGLFEMPSVDELRTFLGAIRQEAKQELCILLSGETAWLNPLLSMVRELHPEVYSHVKDVQSIIVTPPKPIGIRADELHDDIRLTASYIQGNENCALLEAFTERASSSAETEFLLHTLTIAESAFLLKTLSETMPPLHSSDRPLAAMYQDDDGALLVRSAITDVALLHEQRDDYLTGEFELRLQEELRKFRPSASPLRGAVTVHLDRTRYVEHYEQNVMALENLTPHQRKVLDKCKEFKKDGMRRIHVMAPAGAGKTFIALFEMLELLRNLHANTTILFVARNPALCYLVARWLCARVEPQEREALLQRLFVLHEATADNTRVRAPLEAVPRACTLEDGSIVRMQPAKTAPTAFDMVVVDEAHHLYRNDDARTKLSSYTEVSSAYVMLLSDVSQSTGTTLEYPADLGKVELTEVVRCSKRIVQAATSFQIGGSAKLDTICHHESDGPPLKSFLFDLPLGADDATRFQLYSEKIVEALHQIIRDFPGLKLQDRVAILVPDNSFCEGLRPQLKLQLERQMLSTFGLGEASRNFKLTTAADAAAVLIGGQRTAQGKEEIVLDTLAAFDGLERLIVIAVGLDAPLTEGADDMLETRSRMYRALTRAHMLAMVVNESVSGGWLEWLGLVTLKEGASFDRQAELDRQNEDAAEAVVSKRTKEVVAALKAAIQQSDTKLEGQDSREIIRKRIDEAVTSGQTAEAAAVAGLTLWHEQGAAVERAFAKQLESNPRSSEVRLAIDAKTELQSRLGSKTGEAANLAARTLMESFVVDQDRKKRTEEIAELCKAEATLAGEEEQKIVAARATKMQGKAKYAVTSALKLLRTKQHEVNEEIDTVLNAYDTSMLADDLNALRQRATSKVYTDGTGVVEVVAIEARKAIAEAAVAAAKLKLSRAAEQWLIGVVLEAVGEGTRAMKAVSDSAAQLAEVVGEVKSAFATAELDNVADTAELAVAVLRGDTTVEAEVRKASVDAAVAAAKLQLSRAAKQWLVEAVTKAVGEGAKVEEAVRSSASCYAEAVEEVKTAFAAADRELGDVDQLVVKVLRGTATVEAEVQKAQIQKHEQTVWDTSGNQQSRLTNAEQLAFCPVRDTAAIVHSSSYTP